jgi:hypothetical protein
MIMAGQDSKPQPQKPLQTNQPKPAQTQVQSTAPKPDKNVVVPTYDLLTEGYDPAKLKIRKP